MIPVKPPAASANRITEGSQKRLSRVRLSSGGVLIITFGEYLEAIDFVFPQPNLPE
jgi:hypothetical protein